MSLPDLALDAVSAELVLKAAKSLYLKEDACGCACACASPGNGGLASASDIGRLPNMPLGGRSLQKRRKDKMKSEENIDTKIPGGNMQMPDMPSVPKQDTDSEPDDSSSDTSSGGNSGTDESMAKRYFKMYEEANRLGKPRTDMKYMVSWLDPNQFGQKLHANQKKMDNGLFYVVFDKKDKGTDFYTDLKNRGINNLKIDVL